MSRLNEITIIIIAITMFIIAMNQIVHLSSYKIRGAAIQACYPSEVSETFKENDTNFVVCKNHKVIKLFVK